MHEPRTSNPLYWPIDVLRRAFSVGDLSPDEVLRMAFARLSAFNPKLHAFLLPLEALAFEQAASAVKAYREGTAGPLAGIPISIKDTFDVAGAVSTRGSLVYRDHVAKSDSGAVRRLRDAGAVFVGKTNTAEFGQSATTDNRLGDDCRNPWNLDCTPGGSSGGAAASVATGIVVAALGADGGGSLRIPASFTGLVGFKPTFGLVRDEGGFPAMSDLCCSGPLTWRVADARRVLSVLADQTFSRADLKQPSRVAFCLRPGGHPVDAKVAAMVADVAKRLAAMGHDVEEVAPPMDGWNDIFGPLVLEEEGRLRGALLKTHHDRLTGYERSTLEAATRLKPATVERARKDHKEFQARIDAFLADHDVLLTPTTAVPAFPVGRRPKMIAGEPVDSLWGAFPFTAAFNVAGTPGMSIPCGLSDGLPVGVQLISARGSDAYLLDFAEQLEEAIDFDTSKLTDSFSDQCRIEALT